MIDYRAAFRMMGATGATGAPPPSERQMVEVTVCDVSEYDGDFPPSELPNFLGWLSQKMAKIPVASHSTAQVVIDADVDESAGIRITYTRPETDAEMHARLQHQANHAQWYKEQTEQRERAEFERLRIKYGEGNK